MVELPAAIVILATGTASSALFTRRGRGRGFDAPPGPEHDPAGPRVPALGGLSIGVAATAGLAFHRGLDIAGLPLLLGAWVFLVLGVLDDRLDLPVVARVTLELGAALVVAALWGAALDAPIVARALLVPWILVVVNGLNFLDGSDGLAACVVVGGLAAALPFPGVGRIPEIFVLATLPFLFFNLRRPAKLYLGDGGARCLGVVLALVTATSAHYGDLARSTGPVLLPLAELITTILRRAASGSSLIHPDRDHLPDRLLAWGAPVRGLALGGGVLAFVLALLLRV
ncbi:MAG: hypothetical protein CME06_04125 [Gemmatimonadetes bacterium]|nr:hypothetical protein [Gemmatimonadota bacterium]